tara:strand:- start:826 stop:2583 length:1758 start_codon:yes stop_codon:yes gene_type:complete
MPLRHLDSMARLSVFTTAQEGEASLIKHLKNFARVVSSIQLLLIIASEKIMLRHMEHLTKRQLFMLLVVTVVLSCLGAIIGIQIITTLGISANTSIIGAVLAILLSKIPLQIFNPFKSLQQQNLVQTAVSSATFSAANGLLISIGVPWALGMPHLVTPMLVGASIAILIDGTILYSMFNTKPYSASNSWPAGVATAEILWAGDKGGKKLVALLSGFAVGIVGVTQGIPMASAGIALIGSIFALFMFAIGLLVRGYSESGLFPFDLAAKYVPHGVMIGAGLIALFQVILIIIRNNKEKEDKQETSYLEPASQIKRTLMTGALLYFVVAILLVFSTQIFIQMSIGMLIGFLIFAMVAAIVQEMIVGMAAMHSGWFPATAAALISLVIGLLIGFPPEALAILVGFCVASGPSFADLGFDLKTGFMIRGYGEDKQMEREGRRLQYFAAMIGFLCAIAMTSLVYEFYFAQDKLVPASRLYAKTIEAGSSPGIASQLLIWALPGALLQLIGGSRNQLGVLFSTGLMIHYPIAGWTVLVALTIRVLIERFTLVKQGSISAFAGGLIAGDALYSAFKVFFPLLKDKLIALFFK